MELVVPDVKYKISYIEAVKEFQADHSFPLMERTWDKLSISELESNFEAHVETVLSGARGENLPEGFVPQTTFWLIDDGVYVGQVRIRHHINHQFLKTIGGHIGYSIRPSKRGKGYGSNILELALPKAKELGINRVLVTCDATNIASRKIIEKNGGVLEGRVPNPETGVDKLRFLIDA